jgi:hypothetical protein
MMYKILFSFDGIDRVYYCETQFDAVVLMDALERRYYDAAMSHTDMAAVAQPPKPGEIRVDVRNRRITRG